MLHFAFSYLLIILMSVTTQPIYEVHFWAYFFLCCLSCSVLISGSFLEVNIRSRDLMTLISPTCLFPWCSHEICTFYTCVWILLWVCFCFPSTFFISSFSGHNYCTVNNGGCTHLCLATPEGRSCRCPDNTVGVDCIERN